MSDSEHFKLTNAVIIAPLIGVVSIWSVYWLELLNKTNFNEYGVYPRSLMGFRGIIFSPFIHGSLEHLYNNTIPLAILLAALFYFYRGIATKVVFLGIVLSGLITWGIGRPSFHIGASGLIYVLASFIFFKGIFTKHFRLVALSLIVVFIYGSLLWYIFPVKEGISWEGHLAGFVTGLTFALLFEAKVPKPKKYDWEREDYNEEDDPFLKHFDADGNFIESVEKNETEETIRIKYHYKENDTDDSSVND
ncbi:rhomboid family intramembrane serine protease [Maribacter litopenaei]|uniref:Rhomboid family intramembrane serine protease n=1 Tax=Maribacter litopenaei TaxID=2976127 RepID=A0ABY5Y992_9FLAO|nr:rhomboid family intramembrane serine protease [Maribacter litopenaei]UWX55586.1 rhomboid family intramembrane serine protease [Maribacter litopenaei]